MLIVTIIPLTLSLFITLFHTRESIKEQSMSENTRLIFQGKTNLVNYLNNINHASMIVYSDPHFVTNISKGLDDFQAVAELYATIQGLQNSISDIHQIYLQSFQSGLATLITNSVSRREYRDKPYEAIAPYLVERTGIEPPHTVHRYGFPPILNENMDETVYTFYRPITKIPSSELLGMLAIDVRLDGIADIGRQLFDASDESLYLLDENGIVIYSGDDTLMGQQIDEKHVRLQSLQGHSGVIDDSDAIWVYEKLGLSYADWTLVKQVPHSVLYRTSTELITINAFIAALALLAVIIGTLYISIRITGPIKQLASYMNQIQAGRLDTNIHIDSQDEIGFLSRQFRGMMDTINNLILRKYKLELANKTNQLQALQAQIDPHFLYNTLQSIGTVALQHSVPRVYTLLSSLADMMRYNMRSDETVVTLQEEVNHLRLYLELQSERFDSQFQVVWELEEDSLSANIPKMTLQPLVENYFKHGLANGPEGGVLTIRSSVSFEGRLRLEIENNGASIPLDRLRRIQAELERVMHDQPERLDERQDEDEAAAGGARASIGLYNVLMRLQLLSDDNASLHIANREPQGVTVTIEYEWRM
ncbi:histidine kinase [Paenibacillus sp. J5C_2022]|uniref:cache domain-containing sensor histidine kinase n=1 Tax=Paenibacillus sp. J5C2022 TaxID=2977129 RepID=UPI0021CFE170|nr:sensor histidine kinase [Paenibacillus sp. J5C2022]MCU6709281.1 histidine kinase [Paenibacillus sp. J5C2022]